MLNRFKMRMGVFICSLAFLPACSGTRPDNIGIIDGKLSGCPTSPNCVSSFATDQKHHIESLKYSAPKEQQFLRLKSLIAKMGNSKVISEKDNYLYAEFTSKIFRFVDDVEFLLDDKTKTLFFRSASRSPGTSDKVERAWRWRTG